VRYELLKTLSSLSKALAVKVLTISEDDEIRGMKHEVTMGNICSSNNNNKGGSKPPRDLTCLLEESEEGGPWFDLFGQFLKHRDQTDLDNGLRFCVQAGKAKSVHEKSGSPLKEESKEELVNILLKIAATHFVSDAPEPVLLANQVLREELADRLPKLGLKSPETEVVGLVEDVWSARNDPKLWKSLDSAFKTFVANKPSPSVSQVAGQIKKEEAIQNSKLTFVKSIPWVVLFYFLVQTTFSSVF